MAHDLLQPTAATGVSVEMVLAEPLLRGTLVAGAAGLGGDVAWCLPLAEVESSATSSEVPTRDLVGVVVHVPSARLTEREPAVRLVERLARRGACAVVAWPGAAGQDVEIDAAARAAEQAGIPLLVGGRDCDYRAVSHLVAMKVLTQSAHVLEYGVRVHRTMGEVFAHGSGLAAMARTMAHLARRTVLILDITGQALAHAAGPGEDARAPATVAGSIVSQLIAQHRIERAQANDAGGPPPDHSRIAELEIDGTLRHVVAAPVTVAGDPYGVVVVLEDPWPAPEHDLAQHRIIVEQGATLVGSELLRQRSVREAEERARDDFVDALLHGRFTDQHELAARSRHYRFDPMARFCVFVITPHLPEPDRRLDARRVANSARSAEHVQPVEGMLTLTALIGSMIVVVRQFPEAAATGPDVLSERAAVRGYADQLFRTMRDRLGDRVRLAYGRPGTGAAGVARSYREARTAVALSQKMDASGISGYDDLRVFAAIQQVAVSGPGRSFAQEVLSPLRKADGQTKNLESIVIAYIEESGNLNAAARRLQLHRNTMLYKLDRASRALQMDVRTSQTQFMVWLAHHIDTLNEVQDALDGELVPPPA